MALAIERRTSPRMAPGALGDNILILDRKKEAMMHARLLDIGTGGALIHFDGVIASGRHLGPAGLQHTGTRLDRGAGRSLRQFEGGRVKFLCPFRPEFVLEATSPRGPGAS